jgi:membrane-associated protease RseP (regulator of RpoE activity)
VACIAGLAMSRVVQISGNVESITLGDSLLFRFLSNTILGSPPEGYDIILHPVAFAGWIGLFITSLNLIPIGQLDGGHVLYAFGPPLHRKTSKVLSVILLIMGGPGLFVFLMKAFFNMDIAFLGNIGEVSWAGWGIWGILMQILGLYHPPVIYWERPLPRSRRVIGLSAFVIFVITFMPVPFHFSI